MMPKFIQLDYLEGSFKLKKKKIKQIFSKVYYHNITHMTIYTLDKNLKNNV